MMNGASGVNLIGQHERVKRVFFCRPQHRSAIVCPVKLTLPHTHTHYCASLDGPHRMETFA